MSEETNILINACDCCENEELRNVCSNSVRLLFLLTVNAAPAAGLAAGEASCFVLLPFVRDIECGTILVLQDMFRCVCA